MNYFALSGYAAGGALFLVLTILLVTSWRGRAQGGLLLTASSLSGLWCFISAYLATGQPVSQALIQTLELLHPAVWFGFLLSAGSNGLRRTSLLVMHGLWIGALVCGIISIVAHAPPAAIAYLLFVFVGLLLTARLYHETPPQDRWAIKFFCIGVGGIFAYDVLFYSHRLLFGQLDPVLWSARGLVNAMAVPLIAVSTARNPQWSLDVFVSRQAVFGATALALGSAYIFGVLAAAQYLRAHGGTGGEILRIALLSGAALLLIVIACSGQARARIKLFISKHFYAYRYDYREEWLRLTSALAKIDSGEPFAQKAIVAMAQIVESTGGSLWLKRENKTFEQVAAWNMSLPEQIIDEQNDGFTKDLASRGEVVDLATRTGGVATPDSSNAHENAWLIVPLLLREALFGFIVLARPRAPIELNCEDYDLLKTAGRQIASALAEHEAAQALADARQFEAYNRLSAFVLHDLKNVTAQLQLTLRNAERHRANPAFIEDVLHTIESAVARTKHLTAQLHQEDISQPPSRVSLSGLLRQVMKECSSQRPAPSLRLPQADCYVAADGAHLATALRNLVQNAQQACNAEGQVVVRLRQEAAQTIIEIEDNGRGMDADFIRDDLFRPFKTTKGSSGMGIGAYQAREYMRGLGGDIRVTSRPAQGTVLKVMLPLATDGAPATTLRQEMMA